MIEFLLADGPITVAGPHIIAVSKVTEEQTYIHVLTFDRPLLVQETYPDVVARITAAMGATP